MSTNYCQNCGSRLTGPFCAQCGSSTTNGKPESAPSLITFPETSAPQISSGRKFFWGFVILSFIGMAWLYFSETETEQRYREIMGTDAPSTTSAKGPRPFLITVTGTEGLSFQGTYMTMQKNGESSSRSVNGVIPATFETLGHIVSLSFQKQSQGGEMKVFIQSKGVTLKTESTTAPYGLVSIATQ